MVAPPGRSAQQRHLITKQASGSAKIDPLMAAFKRHCPHVDEPLVSSSAVICDLGSKPLIEGLAPHRCPFLTLKRTWSAFLGMSEKGQYPTSRWQLGRSRAEPHGRLHRGLSAVPRSANLLLFEYWKWRFSLGVARRRRDFITLLGGLRNDAPHNSRSGRARAAIFE